MVRGHGRAVTPMPSDGAAEAQRGPMARRGATPAQGGSSGLPHTAVWYGTSTCPCWSVGGTGGPRRGARHDDDHLGRLWRAGGAAGQRPASTRAGVAYGHPRPDDLDLRRGALPVGGGGGLC